MAESTSLFDPTLAAVANVRPASLTNGVTPLTPAGDFQAQVGQVLGALSGGAPSKPVIIVGAQTAARLAGLRDLADAGIRVLVSPAAASRIIGIDADGVLYTDDGIELRHGRPDLVMSDTPGAVVQAAGATPVHTSTWQNNMTALKTLRHVNWTKRADAVAFLTLA